MFAFATEEQRIYTIGGHRRVLKLSTPYWKWLEDICQREDITEQDLLNRIFNRMKDLNLSNLPQAIKLFIFVYFSSAALSQDSIPSHITSVSDPATTSDPKTPQPRKRKKKYHSKPKSAFYKKVEDEAFGGEDLNAKK